MVTKTFCLFIHQFCHADFLNFYFLFILSLFSDTASYEISFEMGMVSQ